MRLHNDEKLMTKRVFIKVYNVLEDESISVRSHTNYYLLNYHNSFI